MDKDKLIEEYLEKPIKVGDKVYVLGLGIQDKKSWGYVTDVKEVMSDGSIKILEYDRLKAVPPHEYKKYVGDLGYSPMVKNGIDVRVINYTLESVLSNLELLPNQLNLIKSYNQVEVKDVNGKVVRKDVPSVNFNPFVKDSDGNKYYYHRDFVWTVEQCQDLIESIYNYRDCGKIIVYSRSYEKVMKMIESGETEVAWHDIIDGKQRLLAIEKFLNNEYPDKDGYYFKDFSSVAQHDFLNHQLFSYGQMSNVTDEDIITQFLNVNVAGVPQSMEHLSKVNEILTLILK